MNMFLDAVKDVAVQKQCLSRRPFDSLGKCVAYRADDVAKMESGIADLERVRASVPKKPPHPYTWVEFPCSLGVDRGKMRHPVPAGALVFGTVGCLFIRSGEQWDMKTVARTMEIQGNPVEDRVNLSHDWYAVVVFVRGDRCDAPIMRQYLGRVEVMSAIMFLGLDENGIETDWFAGVPSAGFSGFPTAPVTSDAMAARIRNNAVWPALLAFSLLHCRNVVTETKSGGPRSAKLARQGYQPYSSYKVLKVVLPNDVQSRPTGVGGTGDPKRYHLCRGFFRHLTHVRWTNPGWYWVESHWRGSRELGTVDKVYDLKLEGKPNDSGNNDQRTDDATGG